MFKSRDNDRRPTPDQQVTRVETTNPSAANSESPQLMTTVGPGTTIVGKIASDGTVQIFGRIEGELRASNILISEGAQVEGEVFAQELTVGGYLKGTIHANKVRLNSTSVVEGDVFHRSLAIEENARFEGSSRREENPIDIQALVSENTPQARSAAIESNGKSNGGLADEGNAYPTTP